MRSEEDILEAMKRCARVAAKANDQRYGDANEYYAHHSAATVLGWALGFTQEETEDALTVAVIEEYRESPKMLESYFQGSIPEKFRYLLSV